MDPRVAAQYGTLTSDFALDAIRETWSPVDGAQYLRPIASDAEVSNSGAVRVQYGLTYAPGNLTLNNGLLGSGYLLVTVVDENAI